MESLIIAVLSSSLLASIIGSFINQLYKTRSDKKIRKFRQKEERFFSMLTDSGAFVVGTKDPDKMKKFYEGYRQIWLYASDKTITAINEFFKATGAKPKKWEELNEADKKHGQMILQLRKEFYGKTELKPEDYLILSFRS